MPFVGYSAFPRGQQSSPGHAPCEHNWPLHRPDPAPGRSRCRERRRQVGCQPAATTFPPRRCWGYPEEQQGCIATSRGGHWGTARNPPRGGWRHGTSPQRGRCPGRALPGVCPNTPRCAPKVQGHLPTATTPPWPPEKALCQGEAPGRARL